MSRGMDGKFSGTAYQGQTRAELLTLPNDGWVTALDDGCDVSARCTECPLRQCRFDDRAWFRWAMAYARNHIIVQVLEGSRFNYGLAAKELGVDQRTVFRAQKHIYTCQDPLTAEEIRALTPLVTTGSPPMDPAPSTRSTRPGSWASCRGH